MPQANSTFSSPRATSPRASAIVLPLSRLMISAICLRLREIKSRRLNMIQRGAREASIANLLRRFGRRYGAIDICLVRETNLRDHLAGCGIRHQPFRPDVPDAALP